ncbi:hypothetical protein NP233_g11178 [Leucocoprinus birnbaumii]|uniref:BTB domain-containing protein n=1 Tax=Leucocoprinus birnbaumii TaxID=56174 RepID=A0AAD5VJC8_9AGAR|nr:hypothetical protein NP233_g11178 [Leucocoprinus birnbaumii]
MPPQQGRYYIRGGDLFQLTGEQVEQFLFRIHSYFFLRDSSFWKTELDGPTTSGNRDEEPLQIGNSAATPYILNDENAADFTRFLSVIYNRKYGDFSRADPGDWVVIFRLAAKWDFLEIQALAVEHLQIHEMELVEQIQFYRDNQADGRYLLPLYVELASRDEMLGLDEARILGTETFVLIQQARERLRGQASSSDPMQNPLPPGIQRADIMTIVSETFDIPLASLL